MSIPIGIARRTHAHLRDAGGRGLEGMALWAGVQTGSAFRIEEVIVPEQKGIRSDHGLAVVVPGGELQRINLHLYRSGLRLLAQIHSHPTNAFHSPMDDDFAIATALGSFSLVVPDFARAPFAIASFATYRLAERPWWRSDKRPRWTPVPATAAARIFDVVED